MALTANAQSALPTWDETIVPALRKRLEGESRILAKRMSIASVSSVDDSHRSSTPSLSPRTSRDAHQTPRYLPEPRKSSAIPRPSLQYSRTTTEPRPDASSSHTRVNGASISPSVPPKRARTCSQPPSPNGFTNNPLPTPDSSRPTSPRTSDVKPTRIPVVARTRTTSVSSHAHSIAQRAESRNGSYHRPYHPLTPDTSQDHWVARPSDPLQPATPPMASIRHQRSNIMNEPAPFATSSITSSIRSRTQEPIHLVPRPSTDSEERPFEHWYRGDVHRNGGVGELRVAKHVEMLQIANYGHTIRATVRGQTRNVSGQMDSTRGRKRADSVGAGTQESLYLDDRTMDVDMVFDESPPTDIEADPDTYPDTFYDAYTAVDAEPDADDTVHANVGASTPGRPLVPASSSRSQTPTNAIPDHNTTAKHATHPRAAGGPSAPLRTSAESTAPTRSITGTRARAGSRTTSPTSQLSDQSHTKRRAKSPATSSPTSTPKKARIRAKTTPPMSRREDPRNSIATYPTPEGDMVNAIPTWTQPVQKTGNWDEVVLPVVARKKGLDGQYEQADGSPKPRSSESPVKPAPGTFGFDYTKYRPPRRDEEEIQMHEFGHLPESLSLPGDPVTPQAETPLQPTSPPSLPAPPIRPEELRIQPSLRGTVPRPPQSPAPFSHYRVDHRVPTINITRPSLDTVERRQIQEEEDASGGCCKCVIM
ncbi:hypothetical protein L210DRAFT_961085 [Boletus edulis BED1]|uniref:Uncharacterized protein n=1 Tax=Boletus edulis BED1 TaxID=1328754 RepID=A0AAD4BVT1_BOLED|nr:hypothetical protein L210DRAFT_961085 [Boletus edulis BED1]